MVSLLLQGASVETHADLWRFWLIPHEPEAGVQIAKRIDPKQPVAWRELDKLLSLQEIAYYGTDAGVIAYVSRRETIRTLRWNAHGQARIDLSKSHLTELAIDTSGPLEVHLPRTLTTLRLISARHLPELTLKTDDAGARLAVYVWNPQSKVPFYAGIAALGSLTIAGAANVDLGPFARYTQLHDLLVWGADNGVSIEKLATLAKLPGLARLELRHVYHTDFRALPELPALTSFMIDGIRAADAAHVRKRFASSHALHIRGVRTDAWLKKNADNPFREWEGALATRATRAYRAARAAIEKRADAEKTLAAFIAAFNAVERDIDTVMREEIDEAFHALASDLKVPTKRATSWFEKWREF
jgi:hypothetical protein